MDTDDRSVDVKQALRVAFRILSEGRREDDGNSHRLGGLNASSDLDGYNVALWNDYVRLSIHFHSRFELEFSSPREKALFLERLAALDQT